MDFQVDMNTRMKGQYWGAEYHITFSPPRPMIMLFARPLSGLRNA